MYSPRKFFGVSDGAYLISKDLSEKHTYTQDYSSERMKFIFDSIERCTNICYHSYLNSENDITNAGVMEMSKATEAILGNIDYDGIKDTRIKNYHILCNELNYINLLTPEWEITSPMVYPLLVDNINLRKRLIEKNIYVSQWWKIVLENPMANEWERFLSINIYPLPIDQRYNENDMLELAKIVKGLL